MSQEETAKMMAELKAKTKQAEVKHDEKVKQLHPEQAQQVEQEKLSAKDEEIAQLKKQLQASQREVLDAQSKQEEAETRKDNMSAKKAMDSVLTSEDEYFEKDYSFPTEGKEDFNFHIKMHSPNALEYGRVLSEVERLAKVDDPNTQVADLNPYIQNLYQAIALFKIVGDDVPEVFKHPEQVHKVEILLEVFTDYSDWEATFRDSQRI